MAEASSSRRSSRRTSKKISYAEDQASASSDDDVEKKPTKPAARSGKRQRKSVNPEDEDFDHASVDRDSDAETAVTTARGRRAKKGVVAFDYSKVLELPMDILSMIFGWLHPETLVALCMSNKKLYRFLNNKASNHIWLRSRRNATVYAPKTLNPPYRGPAWLVHSSEPKGFRHYDFLPKSQAPSTVPAGTQVEAVQEVPAPTVDAPIDLDADGAASTEENIDHLSDEALGLQAESEGPLSVIAIPDCPEGMSEYAFARLLFAKYCYICGNSRARKTAFEIFRRYCGSCHHANLCNRGTLSNRIQNSLKEDEAHLCGDISTFMLIQPFCIPANSPHYVRMKHFEVDHIRFYDSDNVVERYKQYRERRMTSTPQEFDAYYKEAFSKRLGSPEKVRDIEEYLYLMTLYKPYAAKQEHLKLLARREAFEAKISSMLRAEYKCTQFLVDEMLGFETKALKKTVKDRNIYDMDVEELMPALRKGMESAKKWYEEYRIPITFVQWRYELTSFFGVAEDDEMYYVPAEDDTLAASLLASLPSVQQLLVQQSSQDHHADNRVAAKGALREGWQAKRAEIQNEATAVQKEIMKDLESKLKVGFAGQALIDDIDHPGALFQCKSCLIRYPHHYASTYNMMSAAEALMHTCLSADPSYPTYESYRSKVPTADSKPTPWQPDRVEVNSEALTIHRMLTEVIRLYNKNHGCLRLNVPDTIQQSESTIHSHPVFRCVLPGCIAATHRFPHSWKDMTSHLYAHLKKGEFADGLKTEWIVASRA